MFTFKTFLTIVLASGFVSAVRGQENDTPPDIHQTIFGATGVGLGKSEFYIMLLCILQYYITLLPESNLIYRFHLNHNFRMLVGQ